MSRINLIALGLLAVVVVWLFTLGKSTIAGIRERGLTVAEPLIRARASVEELGNELASPRLTREQLIAANRRLQRRLQEAAINEKALEQLYEENAQLKHALKLQKVSRFKLVAAEVIRRDTAKWYHTMMIDKGAAHGIAKGDTVIVDRGLVGKVSLASENLSTVLLLTDEACKVTAVVVGTSQQGIVEGQGGGLGSSSENILVAEGQVEGLRGAVNVKPRLRLKHLDKRANVQPSMKVESSGAGRVFPEGLEIGTVVSVHPGEITTEAVVQPSVDFRSLEFVFVITGSKP